MDKMINLRDLLEHEVQDLYSAEEQIIEALPKMIEKANNRELKKALQDHLKVTQQQKDRLDQVKKLLLGEEEGSADKKQPGLFGRLFGGSNHKCKGTEGLIEEGEKVMSENMTPEVLDAAIIACAQKIEHYEICGYGTARAYARELNLGDVAELLEETLDEEYEADDTLTDLAVSRLNEKAQNASDDEDDTEEEVAMPQSTRVRPAAPKAKKAAPKKAAPKKSTVSSKSKTVAKKSKASRGKTSRARS